MSDELPLVESTQIVVNEGGRWSVTNEEKAR